MKKQKIYGLWHKMSQMQKALLLILIILLALACGILIRNPRIEPPDVVFPVNGWPGQVIPPAPYVPPEELASSLPDSELVRTDRFPKLYGISLTNAQCDTTDGECTSYYITNEEIGGYTGKTEAEIMNWFDVLEMQYQSGNNWASTWFDVTPPEQMPYPVDGNESVLEYIKRADPDQTPFVLGYTYMSTDSFVWEWNGSSFVKVEPPPVDYVSYTRDDIRYLDRMLGYMANNKEETFQNGYWHTCIGSTCNYFKETNRSQGAIFNTYNGADANRVDGMTYAEAYCKFVVESNYGGFDGIRDDMTVTHMVLPYMAYNDTDFDGNGQNDLAQFGGWTTNTAWRNQDLLYNYGRMDALNCLRFNEMEVWGNGVAERHRLYSEGTVPDPPQPVPFYSEATQGEILPQPPEAFYVQQESVDGFMIEQTEGNMQKGYWTEWDSGSMYKYDQDYSPATYPSATGANCTWGCVRKTIDDWESAGKVGVMMAVGNPNGGTMREAEVFNLASALQQNSFISFNPYGYTHPSWWPEFSVKYDISSETCSPDYSGDYLDWLGANVSESHRDSMNGETLHDTISNTDGFVSQQSIWGRRFTFGIAIVNPSNTTKTFTLPEGVVWKEIDGTSQISGSVSVGSLRGKIFCDITAMSGAPSPTATFTPTDTPTPNPGDTATPTDTPTETHTPTPLPTETPTPSPGDTPTPINCDFIAGNMIANCSFETYNGTPDNVDYDDWTVEMTPVPLHNETLWGANALVSGDAVSGKTYAEFSTAPGTQYWFRAFVKGEDIVCPVPYNPSFIFEVGSVDIKTTPINHWEQDIDIETWYQVSGSFFATSDMSYVAVTGISNTGYNVVFDNFIVQSHPFASVASINDAITLDATQDTYIGRDHPDSNYADALRNNLSTNLTSVKQEKTILYFDKSSLPASVTIESATLHISVATAEVTTINIYNLIVNSIPTETTWSDYASGQVWDVQGASGENDRDNNVMVEYDIPATVEEIRAVEDIDVTALITAWVSNPATTGQFLIEPTGASREVSFHATDRETISIDITYSSSSTPTPTPTPAPDYIWNGDEDATIKYDDDTNYGSYDNVDVQANYGSISHETLVNFDYILLPEDFEITEAYLDATLSDVVGDDPLTAEIVAIKPEWDTYQVDWFETKDGVSWQAEGAFGVNDVTDPYSETTILSSQVGETITWDITNLVRDWNSGTLWNRGIIVRPSSATDTARYVFAAVGHPTDSPFIIRIYGDVITPTPTITPLPTNTPTSTPTIAPTATDTTTPLPTDTPTNTPTSTPTSTLAPPTDTPTSTPTSTPGPPTSTPTLEVVTITPTVGATPTPCLPTATPTATPVDTSTPTITPTITPTATVTPTPGGPTPPPPTRTPIIPTPTRPA